jgi:dephospho-CoA kinase
MLRVALTGNIASGKSEVAKLIAQAGIPVIDADVLAREAVEPGRPAYRDIVARWGHDILHPDGSLDRAALRRIVFSDPEARAALNAIVHPQVRVLREAKLAEAHERGDALVVSDIPLLFESQLEGEFDRIILVDAPDDVRLQRLLRERGLREPEAHAMMAAQMPSALKRERSDFVIENAGSLDDLDRRVDVVVRALDRLSKGRDT